MDPATRLVAEWKNLYLKKHSRPKECYFSWQQLAKRDWCWHDVSLPPLFENKIAAS